MAYRRTENVLARMEGTRLSILAAAVALIDKQGEVALTIDFMNAVADKIGRSVGTIYNYFQNKEEVISAAVAHVLAGDIDAMRNAAASKTTGPAALACAVAALYRRMSAHGLNVARLLFNRELYMDGLRDELEKLVKDAADMPPKERASTADALIGAVFSMYLLGRETSTFTVANMALRCLGLSDAQARKQAMKALGS